MQNAVERRLAQILEHWSTHAADMDARMLKWLAGVDDLRMVELFFELQNEDGSDLPDLILRFSTDFHAGDTYGDALARAMRAEYEASTEDLAEYNLCDWKPVPLFDRKTAKPDDNLVVTLQSFCDLFGEMFERLALVLTPATVADEAGFEVGSIKPWPCLCRLRCFSSCFVRRKGCVSCNAKVMKIFQ